MLSLIEVQCPHCGARGQIMVPPIGAIIIGPCPQCKELVVVFCGQVLPLNREIMEAGTTEDRRDHLLGILTDFLKEHISKVLSGEEVPQGEDQRDGLGEVGQIDAQESGAIQENGVVHGQGFITQSEFDRFTDVDLKLLDNEAYFKSVFEQK